VVLCQDEGIGLPGCNERRIKGILYGAQSTATVSSDRADTSNSCQRVEVPYRRKRGIRESVRAEQFCWFSV
jgi:hypothetical protein